MTIHLPRELELSLRAEVVMGHFATEDEAVTAILKDYFRSRATDSAASHGMPEANGGLGSIGAMREDAELLDQAVEFAMQMRESLPWRVAPGE